MSLFSIARHPLSTEIGEQNSPFNMEILREIENLGIKQTFIEDRTPRFERGKAASRPGHRTSVGTDDLRADRRPYHDAVSPAPAEDAARAIAKYVVTTIDRDPESR
jgi:hypothetical protein